MSLHRDLRHLRHDVPNDVPQRWSHLPSAHYQDIKMRSLSCLLFALLHFAHTSFDKRDKRPRTAR